MSKGTTKQLATNNTLGAGVVGVGGTTTLGGLGGSTTGSVMGTTNGTGTTKITGTTTCNSCGMNTNYCSCYGGITFAPNTNPSPLVYSAPGTFSISSGDKQRYTVFKLPIKNQLPNKVYVSGRLVTVGILGSDVQAAFTGDKLIFSPGELDIIQYNERLTVSLDYGDWLYHYNIEKNSYNGVVFEGEDSNIVKAKLVSKVAQR